MTFETLDRASEARRVNIAKDLASFYAEMAGTKPVEEKFSMSRMLNLMAAQKFDTGSCYEEGVCRAAAIAQGSGHLGKQAAIVPWGALQRDLTASTPFAGGNLLAAKTGDPMDVLRPFSVVARMGCSTIDNLATDLLLPNVGTAVAGEWLASEASPITASTPTIGQVSSRPKTAGALVKASFRFMKQAQTADAFIRSQLLTAMGAALDAAVLQGTGASGQPTGLSIAAGLNAQSGAVTHGNMLDALETLGNAKADDEKIAFLTTPSVRRLLQARETVTGSGRTLWTGNELVDRPGFVSTDCPAGTIYAGDWSQVLIALWGSGIEIVVDPYTSFQTGAIQVRVLMHADVVILKPAALLRHTSAT